MKFDSWRSSIKICNILFGTLRISRPGQLVTYHRQYSWLLWSPPHCIISSSLFILHQCDFFFSIKLLCEAAIMYCLELAKHERGCINLKEFITICRGQGRQLLLDFIAQHSLYLSQDPIGYFPLITFSSDLFLFWTKLIKPRFFCIKFGAFYHIGLLNFRVFQELRLAARHRTWGPYIDRNDLLSSERPLCTDFCTERWQSCGREMLKIFGNGNCASGTSQDWQNSRTLTTCSRSLWELCRPNSTDSRKGNNILNCITRDYISD